MAHIRFAELSDAKKLAALAERTFRETFWSESTVEDMQAHCRASYGEKIQSEEIANSENITLVVDDHGELIAFAQIRWEYCPACVSGLSAGEIHRLYVDKPWHGKGIAHELMQVCLTILGDHKNDIAWLGVWERNDRAIAFYKKFNFQEVGDHIFHLGKDPQRDIIMELRIVPPN